MSRIFLVDLEAVETRYTGEWKTHLPDLLRKRGHDVQVIDGPEDIPRATTPGAFLNFGGTNIYKSSQVEKIGRLFCDGRISTGDHFIFTDAWHPGIINLKYMGELLGIKVVIHAHHNYFATNFHIKLFCENLLGFTPADTLYDSKIVRSGWPMEYMTDTLLMYKNMPKRDLILFPHRIAPEKQLPIFEDLKQHLPQYEFRVCQEYPLTKNEYHNMLGEAKLVFSANLQETLGISWYEGALVDAIPMVPDRLSYSEMAMEDFKYPSEWTESFESYTKHKSAVIDRVQHYMENYKSYLPRLNKQTDKLTKNYFSCDKLLEMLK